MKPINSKERSKQVWQFIFIFAALAMVPVALIFFAYYKLPAKLSEQESEKLESYIKYESSQKRLRKEMAVLDSCIDLYAYRRPTTSGEVNYSMLNTEISKKLYDLRQLDTSNKIIDLIYKGYEHYFTLALKFREQKDISEKDLADCKKDLKTCTENASSINSIMKGP